MKKPTPKLRTLDNYHLNVSSGQRAPKGWHMSGMTAMECSMSQHGRKWSEMQC
jgi:hypothetical protein